MAKRIETEIRDNIFKQLGKNPRVLILRRNVGLFYTRTGAKIKIGMNGEPDLQGFVADQECYACGAPIHPRPFGIEVKDPEGEQSEDQLKFQKNIWEKRGLDYILAESVQEALEGVYGKANR